VQIGSLNKRIILQYQTKVKSATGATTVSWADGSTIWAAIWPISANEAMRSGQLTLEITHRIRIRYRSDIKGSWRIKFGDHYFSIVSLINPNQANKTLDLLCKETES
jgi:SPP1 family predicted phage head-tail adaptor